VLIPLQLGPQGGELQRRKPSKADLTHA